MQLLKFADLISFSILQDCRTGFKGKFEVPKSLHPFSLCLDSIMAT
jgi:hypothetical protein